MQINKMNREQLKKASKALKNPGNCSFGNKKIFVYLHTFQSLIVQVT